MGRTIIEPITSKPIRETTARGEAIINGPSAVMDARITSLANDLFLSLIFRD